MRAEVKEVCAVGEVADSAPAHARAESAAAESLSLAVQLVAWPAYFVRWWRPGLGEILVRVFCTLAYAVYLFFAARTFYGGGAGRNAFRSLALVFGFTLIPVLAYLLTYAAALYAVTR